MFLACVGRFRRPTRRILHQSFGGKKEQFLGPASRLRSPEARRASPPHKRGDYERVLQACVVHASAVRSRRIYGAVSDSTPSHSPLAFSPPMTVQSTTAPAIGV